MVKVKILNKEKEDGFEVEDNIFDYDDGFTVGIAPRNVLEPKITPPVDIPVVSFYKDDCNAAISFRANIGGYQLPGYDIIHRFAECRNEAEYKPPDYEKSEQVQIPPDDELVHIIFRAEEYRYEQGLKRLSPDPPQCWSRNVKKRELISSEIPCREQLIIKSRRNSSIEGLAYAKMQIRQTDTSETNGCFMGQFNYIAEDLNLFLSDLEAKGFEINLVDGAFGLSSTYKQVLVQESTEYFLASEHGMNGFLIFYGSQHELRSHLEESNIRNTNDVITSDAVFYSRRKDSFPLHVPGDVSGDIEISNIENDFYGLLYIGVGTGLSIVQERDVFKICPGNFNGKFIPPAPPPPDMTCCPDYSDLLKVLLKKVDKLSQIVGVDEYPASLPKSLITENGKNKGNEEVTNLTRLLEWYIKRFDELMGQFEIAIDVDDADLTKEGKQKQTIRLPNVSETLAEMVSLMVQSSINSDLLVNICTRVLAETGADKQQNFKSHQAIIAMIDYLGFNYKESFVDMPLTFKPTEKTFDKMLKEHNVKVKVMEHEGKENLNHHLHELLQAAAIIRAVYWRKLNPSGDVGSEIVKTITNQIGLRDKLGKVDDASLKKLIQELTKTSPVDPNKPEVG